MGAGEWDWGMENGDGEKSDGQASERRIAECLS